MTGKKWLWTIVIIIIILAALWYSGVLNFLMPVVPATTQPAAVTTSVATNTMASQDVAIKSDVAALDTQIAAINSSIAASASPTKQQIATIATNVSISAATFGKLTTELKARTSNAQTSGMSTAALQSSLNDLSMQVSNMTSQAGAAAKNAMATSSTSTTLATSFKQLKAAQGYAVAARADIQTVVQGLGIK